MLCPNCDREIDAIEIKETRSFAVKKERVEIEDRFHRCPHCDEEWSVEGFDALAEVYRVHRKAQVQFDRNHSGQVGMNTHH